MLVEEGLRVPPELREEAKRTQTVLERISGRRLGGQVQELGLGGSDEDEEDDEGPVVVDATEVEAALGRAALEETEQMSEM